MGVHLSAVARYYMCIVPILAIAWRACWQSAPLNFDRLHPLVLRSRTCTARVDCFGGWERPLYVVWWFARGAGTASSASAVSTFSDSYVDQFCTGCFVCFV
jgi:hypothetical protein